MANPPSPQKAAVQPQQVRGEEWVRLARKGRGWITKVMVVAGDRIVRRYEVGDWDLLPQTEKKLMAHAMGSIDEAPSRGRWWLVAGWSGFDSSDECQRMWRGCATESPRVSTPAVAAAMSGSKLGAQVAELKRRWTAEVKKLRTG